MPHFTEENYTYMTGMDIDKHVANLKIEKQTIDPTHFNYSIKINEKPVELAWIACENLTDTIGWVDDKLEGHYPSEFSYYLARTEMKTPVSQEEIAEIVDWQANMKDIKNKKRAEKLRYERAQKNREKHKIEKRPGPITIVFD